MTELLKILPGIIACAGVIIWSIRLEGIVKLNTYKINKQEEDTNKLGVKVEDIKKREESHYEEMLAKISHIEIILAKIEEKLTK